MVAATRTTENRRVAAAFGALPLGTLPVLAARYRGAGLSGAKRAPIITASSGKPREIRWAGTGFETLAKNVARRAPGAAQPLHHARSASVLFKGDVRCRRTVTVAGEPATLEDSVRRGFRDEAVQLEVILRHGVI
jgi:hypothetical protein